MTSNFIKRGVAISTVLVAIVILAGCASVPVSEQGLLAKASMQVADAGGGSRTGAYTARSSADIEPGISDGGSVATTCSSCR